MEKILEQTEETPKKKDGRGGARKGGGRKKQGKQKHFDFLVYEKEFWKIAKIRSDAKEKKMTIKDYIFSKVL